MTRFCTAALAATAVALLATGCTAPKPAPAPASPTTSAVAPATAVPSSSVPFGADVEWASGHVGQLKLTQGYVIATAAAAPEGASATPALAKMTAAYATLTNDGDGEDALASVTTKVAGQAQLHETVTNGNSGTMQQVSEVVVPAHETVELKPGGRHVMLMELSEPLVAGTTVPMTFTFRNGAQITADFPVITREQRPS